MSRIARAVAPRPVIYRTYDFRTNEFRGLEGGAGHEPEEENPMIRYRGCFRYVKDPALFQFELKALARVRRETSNLHLMIPFVRTKWELQRCLALVGPERARRRPVAAPVDHGRGAVGGLLDPGVHARLGIQGISIGSNDLTQLTLGVDRDSALCAELFDEATPPSWTPSAGSSPRRGRRA